MLPDAAVGARVGEHGGGAAGAGSANGFGFSGEGSVLLGDGNVLGSSAGQQAGLASGDLNLIRGFLRKVREQRELAKPQLLSASAGADGVAGERDRRDAREKSEHGCRDCSKETYLCGKRDLSMWQKRPIYVAKETCLHEKRNLSVWQKRPIYRAIETYLCGKKDLSRDFSKRDAFAMLMGLFCHEDRSLFPCR